MKVKRKYIIICIIILFAISTSLVVKNQIKSSKTKNISEENKIELEDTIENNAMGDNEVIENNIIQSSEEQVEEKNNTLEENTKINNSLISKENQQTTSIKSNETGSKEKIQIKTENAKKENQTKESSKKEVKGEKKEEQKVEQNKQQEVKQETKKDNSITNNQSPTQNVETFKINNKMIQQIKTVIENNPSENMKKYGFKVVTDDSIINKTNQFTYTESRVKNAIKFSFGTIKIYARDYFVNGQYVWTESFIL